MTNFMCCMYKGLAFEEMITGLYKYPWYGLDLFDLFHLEMSTQYFPILPSKTWFLSSQYVDYVMYVCDS